MANFFEAIMVNIYPYDGAKCSDNVAIRTFNDLLI